MASSPRSFSRSARLGLIGAALLSLPVVPSGASMLPATGTFELQIGTLAPAVLTGSGTGTSLGGAGSSHTIPAGFFSLTSPLTVFSPPLFGVDSLVLPSGVQNAAGSFSPSGTMPLLGTGQFFTVGGGGAGFIPLPPVGGGGSAGWFFAPLLGTVIGASFQGAGGPTPVVLQANASPFGIPLTVTATAFDNRTAAGRGTVQLVAPATGDLGVFGNIPIFGVLTIQYTPEPASGLLLAAGLAALGAGRTRMRARRAAAGD